VLAVVDVIDNELTDMATHVLPAPTQLERPDVNVPTELAQPVVVGQYTPALRCPPADARSGWWWLARLGDELGIRVLPGGLTLQASDDDVLESVAGPAVAALRNAHETWQVAEHESLLGSAIAARGWNLAPAELVAEWREAMQVQRSIGRLAAIPARRRHHVNATFMADAADARAAINPEDGRELGVADDDTIEVAADGSTLRIAVRLDAAMPRGAISIPHGFADQLVNALTLQSVHNASTGMPAFTGVSVEVRADFDRR
jgi:anaerobic selenocysteine-containing dehydrogenase